MIKSEIKDTLLKQFSTSLVNKLIGYEAIEIFYERFNKKHYVAFPSFKVKQDWVTAISGVQEKFKQTGHKGSGKSMKKSE